MQVLQVQQAMADQAQTKQKAVEPAIQAKIDAEVEKRTKDLAVLPPPFPAKPKAKTAKAAGVAPDLDGDRVSVVSGASKGAKRRRRHAERAVLAARLTVFEEAFEKVAAAATKKKPNGYASEDDTRPSESPDSELRKVITAVQRGIRGLQMANAKEPKTSEDLANTGCALLNKDLSPVKYTLTAPRRSPRRT